MWDERYSLQEYAYGTQPNDFLREYSHLIPKGKVLCIAEGEGRNAVFLAKQGYSVTAVDSSLVGIDKAKKWAKNNAVNIEFIHADLAEYDIGERQWEGIVSIFCPLPKSLRRKVHGNVVQGLKKGGIFLLEAYTPRQVNYGTGGGNSIDLMQTVESLAVELHSLNIQRLIELERDVVEGIYHTGMASVVQAIAEK